MATHFTTVPWASGASMYEVNLRQYTQEGTFASFQKSLPRLKDMGIDVLWFMPITPISMELRQGTLGSYYACSSYTKINPEFGTLDDFKNLVSEAHSLGFKIIIDWVANHTGLDHHWVKEHPEYYIVDEQGNFTEKNGWHDVIDLDFRNTNLQKALITAMKFWVDECDIDGFRCDMAHLVPLDFWKNARVACEANKHLFWLAECEEIPYHDVFDVTYSWQLMHATENVFKENTDLNEVYNVLHAYTQYPSGAKKLFFTSNHDENSWNGTEYEKYGNAAKALAVFTCTWNAMPLIYSGQENPNHKRLKFFDKDVIEWNNEPKLHSFYKTLLALNKTHGISNGETFILPSTNNKVMVYLRRSENEVAIVLLNLSGENKIKILVEHQWLVGIFTNIFSGLSFSFTNKENFELQAFEYLVYYKK